MCEPASPWLLVEDAVTAVVSLSAIGRISDRRGDDVGFFSDRSGAGNALPRPEKAQSSGRDRRLRLFVAG